MRCSFWHEKAADPRDEAFALTEAALRVSIPPRLRSKRAAVRGLYPRFRKNARIAARRADVNSRANDALRFPDAERVN
jgi:hypothetical protein